MVYKRYTVAKTALAITCVAVAFLQNAAFQPTQNTQRRQKALSLTGNYLLTRKEMSNQKHGRIIRKFASSFKIDCSSSSSNFRSVGSRAFASSGVSGSKLARLAISNSARFFFFKRLARVTPRNAVKKEKSRRYVQSHVLQRLLVLEATESLDVREGLLEGGRGRVVISAGRSRHAVLKEHRHLRVEEALGILEV